MDHLPWWVRRHAVLYVVLGNCVILRNVLPSQHRSGAVSHNQGLVLLTPMSATAKLALWISPSSIYWCSFTLCCKTPEFRLLPLTHLSFHIPEYTAGVLLSPQGMIFLWRFGFPSLSRHSEHLEVNLMESSAGESWFCPGVLQKHSQVLVWLLSSWIYLSCWTTLFFLV